MPRIIDNSPAALERARRRKVVWGVERFTSINKCEEAVLGYINGTLDENGIGIATVDGVEYGFRITVSMEKVTE